ncbi:MAG: CBS domain-containing protein [Pseudomonadota bacterium]
MAQIKDVMSPNFKWMAPDSPISQVAQEMRDMDCGFMPLAENDRMVGMITDRDITVRAIAEGKDPSNTAARDVMTAKTYYCFDDQDVEEVCNNMGEIQVRRLPVVNRDKRLVGIVSMGDLAQSASRPNVGQTQQQITAQLQDKQQQQAA